MLYEVVKDFPHEIIHEQDGPFISLYQPTHRYRPENKQDVIRFKNLIKKLENSLTQKYPESKITEIMKPFNALAEDKLFWNNTTDGLAILATKERCIIYKLQRSVEEFVVVANSFHIKPLIRTFQSADRYLLLGLNRKEFVLYEGDRYGFEEIELDPDIPRTITEVLGDRYTESYLTAGTYGGAAGTGTFHGHGGRKEEINKDIERYFRYVDRFVSENYSQPLHLPLMLVSINEYHSLFKNISHNPSLMENGIKKAFDTMSLEELKENAWKVMEPFYLEKTKKVIDRYETEKAKGLASDVLRKVAVAEVENRIDTIMIEADRIIPGKINKETGELEKEDIENPEVGDILNELAEMAFKTKTKVVVLPEERMPSTTGVAAIFRF